MPTDNVIIPIVVILIALCLYFQIGNHNTYTGRLVKHKGRRRNYNMAGEVYEDKYFNNFCQQLWDCDENRLKPDKDYELDLQGRTRNQEDCAEDPLFSRVDPAVFEKPTYKAFVKLLDNYETATGEREIVTSEERQENWDFIDLVFESKPMQLALKFLKYKGKIENDDAKFKHVFYKMWFHLYRRDRALDSSGFEHVFVGETRGKTEVIGFHNWIQFYLQEKLGNVDYRGFMCSDKNPHLLTIQFSWRNGQIKPKGSSLIGVSPEFEIALYTVCYMFGHEAYKIYFDGDPVLIKVHRYRTGEIGSCYPQLPSRYSKKW